jgi:prevent-host-death family protein
VPIVGLRQLSRETRDVLEQLEQDGEPVVVTRHGKPIAALTAVSEEQAAAFALAVVPEFVASRDRAAEAIAAGEGEPASQLLAELDAEDDDQDRENGGELDEVDIPSSLVEQVAEVVARDIPVDATLTREDPVQTAYMAYITNVVQGSLLSVFERVRTVNQNIIEEASGETGELSANAYASELERVAAAEALALRSPYAK